ncbi:Uncharacterised protein [Salmonella enterica subsp. arizonae]|uniref:Uncharacterized protein n=1 Tax=Salmonella enterica subsp. arizonae TaxID=59203 RepID=A0A3S4HFE3_SALER|nr:Uncharacterised protein [Salmonella enterica subsp. arizonae]
MRDIDESYYYKPMINNHYHSHINPCDSDNPIKYRRKVFIRTYKTIIAHVLIF